MPEPFRKLRMVKLVTSHLNWGEIRWNVKYVREGITRFLICHFTSKRLFLQSTLHRMRDIEMHIKPTRTPRSPLRLAEKAPLACTAEIKECNICEKECKFQIFISRTKPILTTSTTAQTPEQPTRPPAPGGLARRSPSQPAGR